MVFAQSGYSRIPVYPRNAGRNHRHAARVRPVQARAGRSAAGAPGGGDAGQPELRRPAARHAARAAPPRRRARRVRRHAGHRHAGGPARGAGGRDLRRARRRGPRRSPRRRPRSSRPTATSRPRRSRSGSGCRCPAGRSTTVGGLLVEWAGRIPNAGERFLVRGLEFDVARGLSHPDRAAADPLRRGTPAVTLAAERLVTAPDDKVERMVDLVRNGELAVFVRRAARVRAGRPGRRPRRAGRATSGWRWCRRCPPELSSQALAEMPEEEHAEETLAALDPGAGGGDRRGARRRRRGRHPAASFRPRTQERILADGRGPRRSRAAAALRRGDRRRPDDDPHGHRARHGHRGRGAGGDPAAGGGGRGLLPGVRGGRRPAPGRQRCRSRTW